MITHRYERYVDGNIEGAPISDIDAKITGHHIVNLKAWLDENPEERIKLGYIKHIYESDPEYDRQTEFVTVRTNVIDEYTVEDITIVKKKSEEMMEAEELGSHLRMGTFIVW